MSCLETVPVRASRTWAATESAAARYTQWVRASQWPEPWARSGQCRPRKGSARGHCSDPTGAESCLCNSGTYIGRSETRPSREGLRTPRKRFRLALGGDPRPRNPDSLRRDPRTGFERSAQRRADRPNTLQLRDLNPALWSHAESPGPPTDVSMTHLFSALGSGPVKS